MTFPTHTRVLSRPVAALIGVLAAAAALAAGHLVAGLINPRSSPYLTVGNTAIDLTPQPVKEFAIETFGTADKLALLIGMGIVIALLAATGGLLSRRGPAPGMVFVAVFGLVGTVATIARPNLGPFTLVPSLVATLAGVGVFAGLHAAARSEAPEPANKQEDGEAAEEEDTGERAPEQGGNRRRFLASSATVAVSAGVAGMVGQTLASRGRVQAARRAIGPITPEVKAPPVPPGADFVKAGTPTFITPNSEFYRIDTALRVPLVGTEDYNLRVHGMVEREINLSFADLLRRRQVEKTITMTCVSNPVGGSYISTAKFVGVPISDVLAEAGVRPGAQQVFSSSAYNSFTAGTPVDVLTEPDRDALLALAMNGEPLPAEHGFPVRMVVPGLYGYVSATKWVTDLELTTWDKKTYWEKRGWAERAPIKTQSRIDRPQGFDKVEAGTLTVAGIAWAQTVGIKRVEVRLDKGSWQEAELAEPVNIDTWRMWRIDLQVPAGGHTVEVRATDRSGYTQTPERVPTVPDGATGWHSVFFTAE